VAGNTHPGDSPVQPPEGYVRPIPPPLAPQQWQPPLHRNEKSNKRMIVGILIIILAILSIIFMAISMTMPWYNISVEASSPVISIKADEYYYISEIKSEVSSSEDSTTISWEDRADEGLEKTANVYNTVKIMIFLSFIMGILLIIGAIIGIIGKGKIIAIIFGLILFLFCILTPLYFMIMHPIAMKEDIEARLEVESEGIIEEKGPHDTFQGYYEVSEENGGSTTSQRVTWGPENGFYITIIGLIFGMLGFVLSFALPKSDITTNQQNFRPPPPPRPGYGR
jgi:energy-coupling factor transporter transmembrane protein EcfT